MSDDRKNTLLSNPQEILDGLNTYIDGKMKRYSLLFAVNGGAFAIAKLLGEQQTGKVVGGLTLEAVAIGAIIFTCLMWLDIYLFGETMRSKFFGNRLVFGRPGKLILSALSALLILGWLLAAFWPE
jgi:hypothetical protein